MADLKISELTNLTAADPANDMIPIVDVSATPPASGSTKRISINNILACSPTATLASATITGDLTVDTSVFKVNTATDQVGIGTATPTSSTRLDVVGGAFARFNKGAANQYHLRIGNSAKDYGLYVDIDNNGTNGFALYDITAGVDMFRYVPGASGSWTYYINGTTAMTLNSTGLGVGVSPSYKLDVLSTGVIAQFLRDLTVDTGIQLQADNSGSIIKCIGNQGLRFNVSSADAVTIDSTGNVGIGNTPIASHILSCSGPIAITGTSGGTRNSYISNTNACSIYYTDGGGSGFFTDYGNLIIQPRTSAARSVVIATGSTTPVERAVVKSTGQVRFVPLASDPAGAEAGDVYYNSTSNKLKCYNGTTWNDLF